MQWWQAIILGLVEGITEYLPISSTGHLILARALLGIGQDAASEEAAKAFDIVVQGGAILAVLGLYWPRVLQMLRGIAGRDANGLRLVINLFLAFLPAAALGPLLNNWIDSRLMRPVPVLAALFLGGIWMIWIDRWRRRNEMRGEHASIIPGGMTIDRLTPVQAVAIGLFQCVAMWPGTSRSMMTIAGGTMIGLRPKEAAEFSFLLGLPTLTAACLYKLVKNLKTSHENGTPNLFETLGIGSVLLGMVVAAVSAAFAVRWLVAFLNRHGLAAFGVYRILLSIVFAALIAIGWIQFG